MERDIPTMAAIALAYRRTTAEREPEAGDGQVIVVR